ncbi:MAG TPA: pitrilysin family protein [Acidimicrobiales bacterium]|nr:pitrilysin family protein [Acidimicrobiales bacterium]
MIRTTRLGNGIHVVTEWMPGSHSVTTGYWVDAGSRDEEPAIAGASHFLEHLLFKGTATRSARDIAESIEAVGGDMNAFTTKEYTSFYTRLLDDDLDLGLDILSDIMWAPAFRPEEIEAERQVILEEILMHEDEPSDLVHELFNDALFPGHPLGRPVLGDRSTITAMTRDAINEYFEALYRPESIVVAAAGNVDHDRVVAGVEKRFDGRLGARPPRQRPALPPARSVVVHNRPTEQAHLVVGMRALDRADDDRFTLSVLNQVLGGGMSSRLFQEIREKRGLVYSVYSYRAAYVESGALAIYAGTSPGRAHEVLELIDEELDRLLESGVSERELTVAKGHVKGSLALSLEDSAGRMSRIGRSQLVHGTVMTFDELVARTEAVTADDLRRVTDRVIRGERVLAVVGPFAEDAFPARVA